MIICYTPPYAPVKNYFLPGLKKRAIRASGLAEQATAKRLMPPPTALPPRVQNEPGLGPRRTRGG